MAPDRLRDAVAALDSLGAEARVGHPLDHQEVAVRPAEIDHLDLLVRRQQGAQLALEQGVVARFLSAACRAEQTAATQVLDRLETPRAGGEIGQGQRLGTCRDLLHERCRQRLDRVGARPLKRPG